MMSISILAFKTPYPLFRISRNLSVLFRKISQYFNPAPSIWTSHEHAPSEAKTYLDNVPCA